MARYYLESGITNGTFRDGHRFDVTPKSRRIVADEQFGMNGKRTLGVVETDCASCIEDLNRIGASTNQLLVLKNYDELSFELGKSTKARATVASLTEQLQSLLEA